jgi:hypothetical protein
LGVHCGSLGKGNGKSKDNDNSKSELQRFWLRQNDGYFWLRQNDGFK